MPRPTSGPSKSDASRHSTTPGVASLAVRTRRRISRARGAGASCTQAPERASSTRAAHNPLNQSGGQSKSASRVELHRTVVLYGEEALKKSARGAAPYRPRARACALTCRNGSVGRGGGRAAAHLRFGPGTGAIWEASPRFATMKSDFEITERVKLQRKR